MTKLPLLGQLRYLVVKFVKAQVSQSAIQKCSRQLLGDNSYESRRKGWRQGVNRRLKFRLKSFRTDNNGLNSVFGYCNPTISLYD